MTIRKMKLNRLIYLLEIMNFSYHYQTAHLEEHDMELLYYYMMRILFKGIAEPDMSIGEIMELV